MGQSLLLVWSHCRWKIWTDIKLNECDLCWENKQTQLSLISQKFFWSVPEKVWEFLCQSVHVFVCSERTSHLFISHSVRHDLPLTCWALVLPKLFKTQRRVPSSHLCEFGPACSVSELAAEIDRLCGIRLHLLVDSHFLSPDTWRQTKKEDKEGDYASSTKPILFE